ncbi:hypothetical protein BJX64DRAFT_241367 [Aspergillus heterothallicus]
MDHLTSLAQSRVSSPGLHVAFKPHPQLPAQPCTLKKLVAPRDQVHTYTDWQYVIGLAGSAIYILVLPFCPLGLFLFSLSSHSPTFSPPFHDHHTTRCGLNSQAR